MLVSLAYAVTVSFLYQRATESERLAEERAADVSEQYAITREAIAFLVGEVSRKLNQTPGNTRARRDILEGAFDRLLPLVEQHSGDPILLEELMRAHYQLGDIAIALNRFEKARQHLQEALDLRLRLSPRESQSSEELAELSINYALLGDVAQKAGDEDAHEHWHRKALEIDEGLVDAYPGNAHFLDNLAWSYNRLSYFAENVRKDLPEALGLTLRQLAIMQRLAEAEPEHVIRLHGLAAAHGRLVWLADRVGDSASAAHHDERALAISERVFAAAGNDPFLLLNHILIVRHHFSRAGEIPPDWSRCRTGSSRAHAGGFT